MSDLYPVRRLLYLLIAVLLLPALLVNLGVVPFIDDEGIRSLVALEMLWRDNFVVPTLHGDAYLNKPPLWNWILALSFTFWGEASEWSARFPTVIALLGFAGCTYAFSRHFLGKTLALVHALTVITCGRMLFWDSMLALIDVCFSWVIYTQMLWLYHYGRRDRWWTAFAGSYFLTAIAFLLKGFPAIVFAGLTVLPYLFWRRAAARFFSPAHLVSGIGCLFLVGVYYFFYGQYLDLGAVFERLFVESGKRTAVNYGWGETLQHLVAFPLEMTYHFLPWTLLILFFFRRDYWALLKENDAGAYLLLIFLANVPIYWLSPNVYPRYLLMLFPLLFGAGLVLYRVHFRERTSVLQWVHGFLAVLMSLCAIGFFFIPLVPKTAIVAGRWPLAVACGLLGLGLVFWFLALCFPRRISWMKGGMTSPVQALLRKANVFVTKADRTAGTALLVFAAFLLLLRVVLNVFVLPPRAVDDVRGREVKRSAEALGKSYGHSKQPLAVFGYTLMEPATSFYLERAYGGIVPRHFDERDCTTDYIVNEWQYPNVAPAGTLRDSLFMRHQPNDPYYPVVDLCDAPDTLSTDYPVLLDGMGSGLPQ